MSNTTLIVPCAGKSTRFPDSDPKWMLKNDYNQTMLSMAIEPYVNKVSRIVVAVTKEQFVKHRLLNFFLKNIQYPASLCVLEKQTSSAAETVHQTIQDQEIKGNIIIKDCDCYVDYPKEISNNYIVGVDVKKSNDISRLESKSFIKKDSNDIIVDIIEKKIVSGNICVGTYACEAENFCKSYMDLRQNPVFSKDVEIYVSYVFSKMILESRSVFSYVEASKYIDWGTVEDWNANKSKINE